VCRYAEGTRCWAALRFGLSICPPGPAISHEAYVAKTEWHADGRTANVEFNFWIE